MPICRSEREHWGPRALGQGWGLEAPVCGALALAVCGRCGDLGPGRPVFHFSSAGFGFGLVFVL